MLRVFVRMAVAAGCGALIGALMLMVAYPASSTVLLDMDREPPSYLAGAYPSERDGDRTFVWTSSRAVLRLAGLDRRAAWHCTLHVRGARDSSLPQPDLVLSFDGAGGTTTRLSNEFQDVSIDVPARPDRPGLTLSADVAPTFRPGPSDPRDLGAQVDWLRCTASAWVWPPSAALRAAAVGAASVAVAGVVVGAPLALLMTMLLVTAAGQAWLLVYGGGAFGTYPPLLTLVMMSGAVVLCLVVWAPTFLRRAPLTGPALVAVTASAVLATLKLAALTHPAKLLIDAVFQAHRLQWVLSGRYFFTQPMPDGVQFPYAIGLYVTAAPLATFITDHVLLVRMVVLVVEAIGGALLYAVITRAFQDRVAGVLAVVLFHLVPLPYVVVGNANLTNAFAQAVGLVALCGLALMPVPSRSPRFLAAGVGVGLLTALAFLSHVGSIVLVAGILGAIVVVFLLARRQDLTRLAAFVVVMTMLAGLLAIGLYYRHFMNVYTEALDRVRAPAVATVAPPVDRPGAPAILVRRLAWHERVANSASQTMADFGWPLLSLGVVGVLTRVRGRRERVPLLLVAWGAAWGLFLVAGTLMRVEIAFQRYAAEFVARVNLAAYPALVTAAALGATTLWRWGPAARVAAVGLVLAASVLGLTSWTGWIR